MEISHFKNWIVYLLFKNSILRFILKYFIKGLEYIYRNISTRVNILYAISPNSYCIRVNYISIFKVFSRCILDVYF